MPKRENLLSELQGEHDYGVLLMSQMDAVPETLQFVMATTQYDETAQGLRDRTRYVIRAIGVHEHRISLGMFRTLRFVDDHPLLYEHNTVPVGVFFKGKPQNANELLLDLMQAYSSTFGVWRTFPQYLNIGQPLLDLLDRGGGLLGEVPQPLAERLEKVLRHHQLETKLIAAEKIGMGEDGHGIKQSALLMDDSFVVASSFAVDTLGKG